MKISDAIEFLAAQNNTSPEEIRISIQEAIEAAKDNQRFKELFGNKIPSVDDFIETIVMMLQAPEGPAQ